MELQVALPGRHAGKTEPVTKLDQLPYKRLKGRRTFSIQGVDDDGTKRDDLAWV